MSEDREIQTPVTDFIRRLRRMKLDSEQWTWALIGATITDVFLDGDIAYIQVEHPDDVPGFATVLKVHPSEIAWNTIVEEQR